MSHPEFFSRGSCLYCSQLRCSMSGVVAGGKRAPPAFRQPPHHSSSEAPKALRRARAAGKNFGMTHSNGECVACFSGCARKTRHTLTKKAREAGQEAEKNHHSQALPLHSMPLVYSSI